MKHLVADLYEHIFLFLNGVMDWILSKRYRRLLDSLTDDFNERFDGETKKINQKAERVRILALQSSRAEIRVTRLVAEGLSRDVRLGLDGQERYEAEMRLQAERMGQKIDKIAEDNRRQRDDMMTLGQAVKALLEADAVKWLSWQNASNTISTVGSHPLETLASNTSGVFTPQLRSCLIIIELTQIP